MNEVVNLCKFIFISQLIDDFSKEIAKLLKSKGVSDEEIQILDKYSTMYLWLICMENYIQEKRNFVGYRLYDIVLLILNKTICSIDDFDLSKTMKEFLNFQTIEKATEIINKIKEKAPIDLIKCSIDKFLQIISEEKIGFQKEI